MTADHAAQAIIDLIVANLLTLNANTDLLASGYAFSTQAMPETTDDTSPYKYLKVGDRRSIAEGLTVCAIPRGDELTERLTQDLAERKARVTIACYFRGCKDPAVATEARRGAVDALYALLCLNRTITLSPVGIFYGCTVGDRLYGSDMKVDMQGELIPVAILEWSGMFYTVENNGW